MRECGGLRVGGEMNGGTWGLRTILSANSLAALRQSLLVIVQRLGFKFFVLCSCGPQLDGAPEIRLDNCPVAWLEYRSQRRLEGILDPMHRLALQETTPA